MLYLSGGTGRNGPRTANRRRRKTNMSIVRKPTSCGLAEIRQERGQYVLYVNGRVKCYSTDFETVMREYDRIY